MSERVRLNPETEGNPYGGVQQTDFSNFGLYFASEKTHLEFVSTGCTLLDCALGGGFCLGRVENIVGDKSTCKTLLASEVAANFSIRYPKGKIYYREPEFAFDREYAASLGFPVSKMDFGDEDRFNTVEDFDRDLLKCLEESKKLKVPSLYCLDSLDSLADEGELERDIGEGSYNTGKAKAMSQIFRKRMHDIHDARMCLLIISQERDNIGVTFGRKSTRSGGRALDFYATHIVWLAHLKDLPKQVKGIKRPIGVKIKAKVDKNKIGLPHRTVEFDFLFGFGIDNFTGNIDFINDAGRYDTLGLLNDEKALKEYYNSVNKLDDVQYWREVNKTVAAVKKLWPEIEQGFLPTRRKYNNE